MGIKEKGKCHSCGDAEPQLWLCLVTFYSGVTTKPCWDRTLCYSFWCLDMSFTFSFLFGEQVLWKWLCVPFYNCPSIFCGLTSLSPSIPWGFGGYNAKHVISLIWFLAILCNPVAKFHSCSSPTHPMSALSDGSFGLNCDFFSSQYFFFPHGHLSFHWWHFQNDCPLPSTNPPHLHYLSDHVWKVIMPFR